MPIYAVTYEHPNEDGWKKHLMPHINWLQARLEDGALLASGPFSDRTVRPAMLIMSAADWMSLDQLIATDPFAEHGLIANMTVNEWDPIFGAFNNLSSMSGRLQGS